MVKDMPRDMPICSLSGNFSRCVFFWFSEGKPSHVLFILSLQFWAEHVCVTGSHLQGIRESEAYCSALEDESVHVGPGVANIWTPCEFDLFHSWKDDSNSTSRFKIPFSYR